MATGRWCGPGGSDPDPPAPHTGWRSNARRAAATGREYVDIPMASDWVVPANLAIRASERDDWGDQGEQGERG